MFDRLRTRLDAGRQDGFTLIELLIVIVILGVLAGIVVFAVGNARGDSVTASCKADIKTVNTAAEAFKAKNGSYPSSLSALVPDFMKAVPSTAEYTISLSGGTASGTKSAANGGGAC